MPDTSTSLEGITYTTAEGSTIELAKESVNLDLPDKAKEIRAVHFEELKQRCITASHHLPAQNSRRRRKIIYNKPCRSLTQTEIHKNYGGEKLTAIQMEKLVEIDAPLKELVIKLLTTGRVYSVNSFQKALYSYGYEVKKNTISASIATMIRTTDIGYFIKCNTQDTPYSYVMHPKFIERVAFQDMVNLARVAENKPVTIQSLIRKHGDSIEKAYQEALAEIEEGTRKKPEKRKPIVKKLNSTFHVDEFDNKENETDPDTTKKATDIAPNNNQISDIITGLIAKMASIKAPTDISKIGINIDLNVRFGVIKEPTKEHQTQE